MPNKKKAAKKAAKKSVKTKKRSRKMSDDFETTEGETEQQDQPEQSEDTPPTRAEFDELKAQVEEIVSILDTEYGLRKPVEPPVPEKASKSTGVAPAAVGGVPGPPQPTVRAAPTPLTATVNAVHTIASV